MSKEIEGHNWSDSDITKVFEMMDSIRICNDTQSFIDLDKSDIIVIARHFKLTNHDLKCEHFGESCKLVETKNVQPNSFNIRIDETNPYWSHVLQIKPTKSEEDKNA